MRNLAIILVAFMLAGCATILSGTTQTINVKIVDAANQADLSGVICTVVDGNGNSNAIVSNPAVIRVSKGDGGLVIHCKKSGYRQLNMSVGDSFNALTVVNVLFWPGFIIDAASGAYRKYPSHYMITMEKIK